MTILLSDTGKRFNRDWIFRHLTYTFEAGNSYAITGPNGSGKSTLLQAISGSLQVSEGNILYSTANNQISIEDVYRQVSICAPYLELVEEMTLAEFLSFHQNFKDFIPGITTEKIISILTLENAAHKQIRYYSSGMKQRVKLAQCIFSNTAIVLLDEPCTNLDRTGIDLYHQLIEEYCSKRTVVVSSNDKVEYDFCKNVISILDYKS
ncbi:MAG: ATP-binding cassette domain-containing protein [Bacteroidetes bacterium]|nr:ATP-binding cassette domain-containing protein [Bacteroidota bacterium]